MDGRKEMWCAHEAYIRSELNINSTTEGAELKGPTPLIPKPAIGQDPEAVPTVSHPYNLSPKHLTSFSPPLQSGRILRGFHTKTLYTFSVSSILAKIFV